MSFGPAPNLASSPFHQLIKGLKINHKIRKDKFRADNANINTECQRVQIGVKNLITALSTYKLCIAQVSRRI